MAISGQLILGWKRNMGRKVPLTGVVSMLESGRAKRQRENILYIIVCCLLVRLLAPHNTYYLPINQVPLMVYATCANCRYGQLFILGWLCRVLKIIIDSRSRYSCFSALPWWPDCSFRISLSFPDAMRGATRIRDFYRYLSDTASSLYLLDCFNLKSRTDRKESHFLPRDASRLSGSRDDYVLC